MKNIVRLFLALILICTPVVANNFIYNGNFTMPVVHGKVVDTTLSYEELRAIYTLGITKWTNGQKIVVVIMTDTNPMQRRFLWEYLGMSTARYKELVDAQVIGGKTRPTVVKTHAMMIAKVSSTPGAIGFIDTSLSEVTLAKKLKPPKVYSSK